MTRKPWLRALTIAVPVLILAYAGWWWWLAQRVETGLADWLTEQRAAGRVAETGNVTLAGFPFALKLTLSAPVLTDPAGDRWQGPALLASLSPFRPDHPTLEAPGHHTVTLHGAPPVTIDATKADADLSVDSFGPAQVDLDAGGLTASGTTVATLAASWKRLATGPVAHDQASMHLDATATDITLPSVPAPWLDKHIASAKLSARLQGSAAGIDRNAINAWSGDGGTIELESFALSWPPADLDGSATLALDPKLQPLMSGTVRLRGLTELIDKMKASGALTDQQAGFARLAVAALSAQSPNGAMLPITLQNGLVSLGPLPLFRLPPLDLPN